MPLQVVDTPYYIKRTKVFAEHVIGEPRDPSSTLPPKYVDYTVTVPEQIRNIVGIELRDYAIRSSLTPVFSGRLDTMFVNYPGDTQRATIAGNSRMDVLLSESSGTSLLLQIDMENIITESFANQYGVLGDYYMWLVNTGVVFSHLAVAAQQTVLDSTWEFTRQTPASPVPQAIAEGLFIVFLSTVPFPYAPRRYALFMQDTNAPNGFADVSLLFASGPNEADSMHRQLGYEKIDTIPDPVWGGTLSTYTINTNPSRYIDVTVREAPELNPVGRIFLNDHKMTKPVNQIPTAVRWLHKPIQRLHEFNVSLRLEGGRRLASTEDPTHWLGFEIISLEPAANIPGWVDQNFIY
jgi:hypothetical protein